VFIVYATTLPFDFSASSDLIKSRLQRLWDNPMQGAYRRDVISNILFFMPWGFLLGLWSAQRGNSFVAALIQAAFSASVLSTSVELIQLFSPTRTPSVIDVLTDTIGSGVGALVGWPVANWVWHALSIRIRQLATWRPLAACSLAVVPALILAGLAPFRPRLELRELQTAIADVRLVPFGSTLQSDTPPAEPWSWAREILTWVLVGALFTLAGRESGLRRSCAMFLAVSSVGLLSMVIQVLHLLIAKQRLDMTIVALALAGSAIGASAVVRTQSGDARRWITHAGLLWALAAALAAWDPFRFAWPDESRLHLEMLVPFLTYFYTRNLDNLADVVIQALAFIPMGVLLAARSWRQSALGAALTGLGVGALLEIGQVFIPARTPDITDVISSAVGALVGAALWRWGESFRRSSQGVARYSIGLKY
jgi:VanZ family protein